MPFGVNVSPFVEEQSALICQFHSADFLRNRAGERSLFMSKQFTLQQAGGNGSTIQLHKRAIFASAAVVNGTGDQLLACTCLSKQQDCRVAGSDRFNKFQNMFQRWAVSDDVFKAHLAADFFFEIELLLGELIFELRNLVVGTSIFNGDGNLA